MFKVRTYNQISNKGLSRFDRDRYEIGGELPQPDAFMLRSQKLHDIEIPESLVAVARAGAGVNNIPVDRYTAKGIVVFNTPGANANAVKELVAAGLLLASRDIFQGMNYVQSLTGIGSAGEMSALLEKEKKRFAGCELYGKTLGVVGLGQIGVRLANCLDRLMIVHERPEGIGKPKRRVDGHRDTAGSTREADPTERKEVFEKLSR